MRLSFTKMQASGNDFVVLAQPACAITPTLVKALADRTRGVGCDQVLVVSHPESPEADFRYRIFNADGREVSQCANGARCVARLVRERGLHSEGLVRLQTSSRILVCDPATREGVRLFLGEALFAPRDVPMTASEEAPVYTLPFEGASLSFSAVSVGNPHAVFFDPIVLEKVGPFLGTNPLFPEGANVSAARVIARDEIELEVWERGVGATLSCGSAACAAVAVGRRRGLLSEAVRVHQKGGTSTVELGASGIGLSGPVSFVFDGVLDDSFLGSSASVW